MERHEWNEYVGAKGDVIDDLEFQLFASRAALRRLYEGDEGDNKQMIEQFKRNVWLARVALIALYPKL